METYTWVALIVLFGIIVGFQIYRRRVKVELKGPGGTGLNFEGENSPPPTSPTIQVEDVESRRGGVQLEDQVGHGIGMKKVKAQEDIRAVSSHSPKALPPTEDRGKR